MHIHLKKNNPAVESAIILRIYILRIVIVVFLIGGGWGGGTM